MTVPSRSAQGRVCPSETLQQLPLLVGGRPALHTMVSDDNRGIRGAIRVTLRFCFLLPNLRVAGQSLPTANPARKTRAVAVAAATFDCIRLLDRANRGAIALLDDVYFE